ncbi:MAG TPA: hypothetical protein VH573_18435 [Mycobacteriales bacterium]|jgi:hypothetical protein
MELGPYVDTLRQELGTAAAAGGDEARALAERLTAPLESAARLTLLDALSAAAAEITRELAPGSVDVLLRNREPVFVVTAPPVDEPAQAPSPVDAPPPPADSEDAATARINFRLPDSLKSRIEDAAARAGLSVNAWLVRATATALESSLRAEGTDRGTGARGHQRYSGWVR